jgi:isocitrate dehydrogenase
VRSYNIAAIPGNGIGQEVVAAAVEVLLACAERDKGFALDFTNFDWGSERYKKFGALMPADGIENIVAIRRHTFRVRRRSGRTGPNPRFGVFDCDMSVVGAIRQTSDRHVF